MPVFTTAVSSDTYIKLIKRRYCHVDVGELLAYAGMKGRWFIGAFVRGRQ